VADPFELGPATRGPVYDAAAGGPRPSDAELGPAGSGCPAPSMLLALLGAADTAAASGGGLGLEDAGTPPEYSMGISVSSQRNCATCLYASISHGLSFMDAARATSAGLGGASGDAPAPGILRHRSMLFIHAPREACLYVRNCFSNIFQTRFPGNSQGTSTLLCSLK